MARRRPIVPKNSPRYQSALRRAQAAQEQHDMGPAHEQLMRENKIRSMMGQMPQTMGGESASTIMRRKGRKIPFQR